MAIQTQQSTIMIKRPPVYAKQEKIDNMITACEELEKIKKVTNDYYGQLYRAIRSLQNVINMAMDRRGDILPQIAHQQVQEDAVRAENLEPGLKPFSTTLMFWTLPSFPLGAGSRLVWNRFGAQLPWADSEIYYGDYDTGVFSQALIAPGQYFPLSGAILQPTYMYFDPRSAPTYPPAAYTLTPATGLAGGVQAFRDGHIVLCIAWRTKDNAGAWANADNSTPIWGGGLNIIGT